MGELRCIMCGKSLTYEELDHQEIVFMSTVLNKPMMLCTKDYKRIYTLFEKGEIPHARITKEQNSGNTTTKSH